MTEFQVLYRKYRPQDLSEVIGQERVVESLSQGIKKKSPSHAYLFHGGRGTGKTSVARILARSLETAPEDIYEIDAASNRSIDDVRALREEVRTLPFSSRYKVYIIDEVHMLTKEAWNALLKTLEEPPAHALFILATTELHKVPDTILSRSEIHAFQSPSLETLANVVLSVSEKEGVTIEKEAAELVARHGKGSFRDTLGVLQRLITASGKKSISREMAEKIIGEPDRELVGIFIQQMIAKNSAEALSAFEQALSAGISAEVFVRKIIDECRNELMEKIKNKKESAMTSGHLRTLIQAYSEMKHAPNPELPIELLLADQLL